MSNHNASAGALSSADEIIHVDFQLRQLLRLTQSVSAKLHALDYPVPVKRVHQCPGCGEGVARISLDGEVRLVDASIDQLRSGAWNRVWTANALSVHECGGSR